MRIGRVFAVILVGALLDAPAHGQTTDPAAGLEQIAAAAEASLREGELQLAESDYRSALFAAWMIVGTLRVDEHRLADARDAFSRASTSTADAKAALRWLAMVHLQLGETSKAIGILTRLAGMNPKDVESHRLLAQALIASGQPDQAVQELEEAHGAAPDDLELTFTLASGYLRLNKADQAEKLFQQIAAAKPLADTHVLIGRAYRDAGEYERARSELETALELDPRVRRAHLYLGTIVINVDGVSHADEAITHFEAELKLAPSDPVTNLRLGMALVDAQRFADALPRLQKSVRAPSAPADAFYYLGRCQLGLDRPADAVASLQRALDMTRDRPGDIRRLRSVQYQLGVALRQVGKADEADALFAAAQTSSADVVTSTRAHLERYLSDAAEPIDVSASIPLPVSPLSSLKATDKRDVERRATTVIARAALNLGVMHAQQQRFDRAAEFFAEAVAADAAFPKAQYSLGVAYFNAKQYEKAVAPLARALDEQPDADVRRMLALAYLNTDVYDKAAALLNDDPRRDDDPSLAYAYGLALVRSDRADEAEAVFSKLMAEHGNTPELTVILGQAHAQQGDFDGAVDLLRKALAAQPTVADANATLGIIYLKQGKFKEAEDALRGELAAHPDNVRARHTLAAVLDLDGRPQEALPLLRTVLKARPGFAEARYLSGKILLAQGAAAEALEELQVAVRLAPEDPNIHYQLAQAYQRLGRGDEAQKEFETVRQLKDKRRGSGR